MQSTSPLSALRYPSSSKARIVVVDDDELILRSLRRLLRGKEHEWDLVFTRDPEEALATLDACRVDVIVSDVRMFVLGGVKLLEAAQTTHPEVSRIVLSGETESTVSLRLAPLAHQFLSKPFDPERLRSTLERACALPSLLKNDSIRAVVGRSNHVPISALAHSAFEKVLANRQATSADVAAVVETDVGLSARILQLASSSFFGASRPATTVAEAVASLGADALRKIAFVDETPRSFRPGAALGRFSVDASNEHALRTARIARAMFGAGPLADDAFVAGLLHGVGQRVLASRVPHRFAEAYDRSRQGSVPLLEVERELIGVTHAQVGAYLLGLWGLREAVVEAVLNHPNPAEIWGVSAAVHVASVLAKDSDAPFGVEPNEALRDVPAAYLERIGVLGELPRFRDFARAVRANAES